MAPVTDPPETHRPVRIMSRDRMSRTVLVGLAGVVCLTVLGVVALIVGSADGATLGAIVAGISGCVGAVSGRSAPTGSSP